MVRTRGILSMVGRPYRFDFPFFKRNTLPYSKLITHSLTFVQTKNLSSFVAPPHIAAYHRKNRYVPFVNIMLGDLSFVYRFPFKQFPLVNVD